MQLCGRTFRDAGVIVFDFGFLLALVCHRVESSWFWGLLGVVMGLGALTVVGLEITRLVVPSFADQWWDPI